ncbi:metallophosphoesterase [Luteolibacter flavescens]|uniref:Metallophosphoesterase n=1 Tax=Luteolibacter flavescens TaxID=1859460 RepID=A0ABT3FJE1_9BACT|nr:metallophosphoesterase [Luteolibacter flavescens]MCW1883677.1 metallophosphoesterase [Luteolibacter flavescens]
MKPHYLLLSAAVLPVATLSAAERILVDFGLANETTSSPDIFAQHWNNIAGVGIQANNSIVNDRGNPTGITVAVTDAFAATSSNSLGGETIYVPTATGDFSYVNKTTNTTAKILVSGLSAERVYDFKFFVSSNRPATQVFKTDYTVVGATSATTSLEAIANRDKVASVSGMVPNQDGQIEITLAAAQTSNEFGGIGILEIVGRDASEPVAADPQQINWANAGQTPNPAAEPNPANPDGLTAYVWETADGFSGHVGAAESLRRAGFHVMPLPLDRPPFEFSDNPADDVDLIVFGSFISQDPRYATYIDTYGDVLDDYVDRCGYLVQLSQADQTEAEPKFLPDTQNAIRVDNDFTEAFILSPTHPMIQGFPTNAAGKVFYTQPHITPHLDDVIWEAFSSFAGFEVILAGDARARFPGLMEGAYGQGQLLLAAMAPDKIINASSGALQADPAYSQFNEAFFENLYTHTRKVRDREAPPIKVTPQPGDSEIAEGAWTIALLPDTQIYSQNRPGVFSAQTAWLRDNADRYNIRMTLHLGDIVNVNSQPEWKAAREAMAILDGHIPYAFVPGNHDHGPSGNASTRDTFLNDYFLFDDYSARPNFGGAMIEGEMDNSYHFFQAGGYDWIVMCLEWGPRNSTIEWADSIMSQHPDKKAILVTHAYMNNNDLRYNHTDTANPQAYNPHAYSTPGGVNDGEELWQKLVKKHNFVLTVNGHVLGDGTGFRTDANDAGQNVHQMLANYQFLAPLGGNGYLRLLVVNPDGTVEVKSYSPIYNDFRSEADQAFEFDFEWYDPADVNDNGIPDYFDPELDSDGDGINNREEFVTLRSNPFSTDSDGDGIPDAIEKQIGTKPAVSNKPVADAILQNAGLFGYFTPAQLIDVNMGQFLIEPEGGVFKLRLQLETTSQLGTVPFAPSGEPVEWTVPATGDKAFMRVRGE